MGYSIFRFGSLYLEGQTQNVPQNPSEGGDISSYKATPHMHSNQPQISIGTTSVTRKKVISWVKPDGMNLFVADRVLLVSVSWQELSDFGFVVGKRIMIDGHSFLCRLLKVGADAQASNEWDDILSATSERDSLWHWNGIYFWGKEANIFKNTECVIRGYHTARFWNSYMATNKPVYVGFRPALEILPVQNAIPNYVLDGQYFRLDIIPGSDSFHPVLYPIQNNAFESISGGQKLRMYTFVEDGQPVLLSNPSKNVARLKLTDKYFGDEYLVPWTISNGVAIVDSTLL